MMKYEKSRRAGLLKARVRARMQGFQRDEDGSMIVFSMFLLVLMLVVSGMAVDFMRFESRRAEMQGVVDRAVLAAADLDQQQDPEAVVLDYFDKAGMLTNHRSTKVTPGNTYREVTTTAELDLTTYFLKLIGINNLVTSASATAIEGVGEIEVSLILDISGSMATELVSTGPNGLPDGGPPPMVIDPNTGLPRVANRMDRVREAASAFVTALLTNDTRDRVSISLVPYTEQVNAGPLILDRLNTTDDHGFSHCIEFAPTHFDTTALDTSHLYQQTQHVQLTAEYDADWNLIPDVVRPICPMFDFERIVPLSQSPLGLINVINQLAPRAGTSIFMGLKWGAALLDPSMRPVLSGLPAGQIDGVFASRPADYPTPGNPSQSRKYMVLLTDGQNSGSNRLRPEFYDTPSERAQWARENLWFYNTTDAGNTWIENWRYAVETPADGDKYMKSICDAIRNRGIILFAISLGSSGNPAVDQHGWDQMQACATTTNLFYKTSGQELVQIFEDIAEQITDLRLTQ